MTGIGLIPFLSSEVVVIPSKKIKHKNNFNHGDEARKGIKVWRNHIGIGREGLLNLG